MRTNIIEHYIDDMGFYTKIPRTLIIDNKLYQKVISKLSGRIPLWVRHKELTCMEDELDNFKNELLGENLYGVIRFAYREPYFSGDMALIGVYYLESNDFKISGPYKQKPDWGKTFSAPIEAVCWSTQLKIYK